MTQFTTIKTGNRSPVVGLERPGIGRGLIVVPHVSISGSRIVAIRRPNWLESVYWGRLGFEWLIREGKEFLLII